MGTKFCTALRSSPWSRVLPSLLAAAEHDPEIRGALATFAAARRTTLRTVFERAQARGELQEGVDLDAAVLRFAAPFFYRRLFTTDELDATVVETEVQATLAVTTR